MSMRAPIRTASLPRLLRGIQTGRPMSFEEHLEAHGTLPALSAGPDAGRRLIDELHRAGLTGCGGAGFPTAVKFEAVARRRGRPVVVANAVEGEPASRKDRVLLRSLPQLVIDGGVIAAETLGARDLVVCAGEHEDLRII